MSSETPSLHALRIDRSTAPARRLPGWLLPGVLMLGAAAGVFWWLKRPAGIEVRTFTVQEEPAAAVSAGPRTALNASGYVTARREATVSSKITGKVVEVLVEEGMKVEKDQVVARLDASNAEAGLRLAEAQVESAKKLLAEAQPPLTLAERELERFHQLKSTGAASELDILRAESAAAAAKARIARLEADVGVAERTLTQFQQQLDDTVIRAPFAGVVTTKDSQPGEMISPMSSGGFTRTGICTIVDMTSLEIEVDVNESYINRVQSGQAAEAVLDAYSDWRIPAKVIAIIPTADRQKATVKVRVGFDHLDARILPEMGVKVSFQTTASETQTAKKILTVPAATVAQVNGRQIVWVLKDGAVERRAITAELRTDGKFNITAGLAAGEKILLDAPAGLADGAKVTEKP